MALPSLVTAGVPAPLYLLLSGTWDPPAGPRWMHGGGAQSPLACSLDAPELENCWLKAVGSGGAVRMGCRGHAKGHAAPRRSPRTTWD